MIVGSCVGIPEVIYKSKKGQTAKSQKLVSDRVNLCFFKPVSLTQKHVSEPVSGPCFLGSFTWCVWPNPSRRWQCVPSVFSGTPPLQTALGTTRSLEPRYLDVTNASDPLLVPRDSASSSPHKSLINHDHQIVYNNRVSPTQMCIQKWIRTPLTSNNPT